MQGKNPKLSNPTFVAAQRQFPGARLRLATWKYDISPQQCRIRELMIFPLHGLSPTNAQQRTISIKIFSFIETVGPSNIRSLHTFGVR